MNGYDMYDYGFRHYYPTIMRTTIVYFYQTTKYITILSGAIA